ncbi:MAG: hypothetical protein KAW19_07870, partial [Candidatus Aminicenantes bacterium]|nr:hypothetical protein [Candidatus Aminicenantes bacterium]
RPGGNWATSCWSNIIISSSITKRPEREKPSNILTGGSGLSSNTRSSSRGLKQDIIKKRESRRRVLIRTDLIPEVYKRSRENRSYQRVLRQRAFYVGSTTRVKNRIHALLSQQSEDVQEEISRVKNLFGTKGMKVIRGLSLPGNQKELLEALVKTFSHLEERRKGANSAKVATARRLLTIIYRMLKENRSYIPYKR